MKITIFLKKLLYQGLMYIVPRKMELNNKINNTNFYYKEENHVIGERQRS
jgi:hypothetical protein